MNVNMNLAVTGTSNVGKTLFCINFAEYLGAKSLSYTECGLYRSGKGMITPESARKLMVAQNKRGSGVVRSFTVNLLRREPIRLILADTSSFTDTYPLPTRERIKLCLSLRALQEADTVLHLIDLICTDPARIDFAYQVNRALSDYCLNSSKPYILAGSKADLLSSRSDNFKHFFSPIGKLISLSSPTGEGFPELRRMLFDGGVY